MGWLSSEDNTVTNVNKTENHITPITKVNIPLDKLADAIEKSAAIGSTDAQYNREAALAIDEANLKFSKALKKAELAQSNEVKKAELAQANEVKKAELAQNNAKLALNTKIKSSELEQKNKIYVSSVLISLAFIVSYLYKKNENKKKVKK